MSAALITLAACAALGFSIQKGGTCMVAAVEEFWTTRRVRLGRSLIETALWVTLLVGVAALLGLTVPATPDAVPGLSVAVGGVLLGLGAWLNGACALGTLAKIGSGQWAFFVTLAGIIVGVEISASAGLISETDMRLRAMPSVGALIFPSGSLLIVLHWRALLGRRDGDREHRKDLQWATVAIGICITIIGLSVGSWSYTAALRAILNHGPLAHRFDLAMLLAILGGAIVGGRIGKVAIKQATRSSLLENARHLGGGLLMGLGGGLVPGGNDQLILFNAPLLEPFAWLALTTMTLTILVCLAFERRSAAASPCPIDTTQ
ncbi:MAG: hypothetical protein E6R12_05340 [Sphingomonadales bacterium]|nr:MAG: hypothetical protein E6R12_05340 [Sphingomonadales bacterium]